jgi:hypothetical protein
MTTRRILPLLDQPLILGDVEQQVDDAELLGDAQAPLLGGRRGRAPFNDERP